MAETATRNDPFIAFRFEIRFKDQAFGGFSDCNGINLETEVQDYTEGGLNTHVLKFPGRTKQTPIVLKRGIVDRSVWDWYFDVTQGKVTYRSGSIVVFDPSGKNVTIQWDFERAFPSKWTGPDLNAAQNTVAIETLELVHQGLKRKQ